MAEAAPARGAVAVVVVPPGDPRHVALVRAAEAELLRRYGDGSLEPPEGAATPEPADVVHLLAVGHDAEPLGCAVVAPLLAAGPGVGELKRLFVPASARRRGVATALLAAAQEAARARGLRGLRLVTGTLQPEAIALYEREGWQPATAYAWADDPMTRTFGKDLDGG
ncbi:GNAT family N-acetyltransferase [Pseudokineococcus basanitobsidens]|uniref:GNAT family N-acetyltransferase n=1 Tax=Pseudokineococcus basanitobsidens TaxID=1926649 RepID=A0ABU8RMN6_9ACTN